MKNKILVKLAAAVLGLATCMVQADADGHCALNVGKYFGEIGQVKDSASGLVQHYNMTLNITKNGTATGSLMIDYNASEQAGEDETPRRKTYKFSLKGCDAGRYTIAGNSSEGHLVVHNINPKLHDITVSGKLIDSTDDRSYFSWGYWKGSPIEQKEIDFTNMNGRLLRIPE